MSTFTITIRYATTPGDQQIELIQVRVTSDDVLEAIGRALVFSQTITLIRIVRIEVDWK